MCNRPNRRTASRSFGLIGAASVSPRQPPVAISLSITPWLGTLDPFGHRPTACLMPQEYVCSIKIEGQLLAHAGRISTRGTGRNRSAGTMPANGCFPRFPSRKRSFRFRPNPVIAHGQTGGPIWSESVLALAGRLERDPLETTPAQLQDETLRRNRLFGRRSLLGPLQSSPGLRSTLGAGLRGAAPTELNESEKLRG
jgi:hypothetical protein